MSLTLLEASKINPGTAVRQAVIEQFARSSGLLNILPIQSINGNAYQYNQEDTLPGVGFRGVNESFTESTGVINPQVESLKIHGGLVQVDRFIVDTQGPRIRSTHMMMKVKAAALQWEKKAIKGDSDSDPREFDGLQKRLTGTQLVSNSAGTGAGLSLDVLDQGIDAVDNPTHLVMNKTTLRRLNAYSRSSGANVVENDRDNFGRRIKLYNGIPIVILQRDETDTEILQFNEAAAGGGSASSSVYVLSVGDGMMTGLQNGEMLVEDRQLQDSATLYTHLVQWYSCIGVFHKRAAARVYGITDAAATA